MGNAQSSSSLTRTTGALDSYVAELGSDILFEKSLGSARFLKTVKCRHRNGYLVIKVFIKPDVGFTLRNYHRRLKVVRESLADIPNIYNYQSFVETDRAGYIVRQWIASNLYDRISTRPFLSAVEKKWIAFQLLTALRDARNRKMSHGDIKSENILVTSWNWVYLSDFASIKPTYLPLDDPSEFSYFFDTSGRRTCYVAPERFYTATDNPEISAKKSKLATSDDGEGRRDGKVTEAMDCFSAGCVIAEVFLEGAPLFSLSQLFKYRTGEYNVDGVLNSIDDEDVRNMIKQMISLDPSSRPTFESLLHTSRGTVFPESFFSFLHNYVASITELPVNSSPFAQTSASPSTANNSEAPTPTTSRPPTSLNATSENIPTGHDVLPSDSDHRIEKIWADYESLVPYLVGSNEPEEIELKTDSPSYMSTAKPFQDVLPVELFIPNRSSQLSRPARTVNEDGPTLIVLSLITANIRNCSLPTAKVRALDVLLSLASWLTDEAKLDRMVPYIIDLLHDDAPMVRLSAFRTLIQVLMLVTAITPSNASIFPEYILPNIRTLVQDPEVSVRCVYARCIVQVAETAVRYLEMGQALKAHGTFKSLPGGEEYDQNHAEDSYDNSMADLQQVIEEHLSLFLMDPSSIVKRAVLRDISYLYSFLGRQKTNDVLLSHMITYLNDRDSLLRLAFFECIVDVVAWAGRRSLEEYILPLMIQALSDVEETVVAKVFSALTSLCELELFQKMRIWELMSATLGFLYHPNVWIRQGAAAFIASAARHLPPSDIWCILYPSLKHFLKTELVEISERELLTAMKPAVSRQIFDAAVQWAMKSEKGIFPRNSKRTKLDSPRDSMVSLRKEPGSMSRIKSAEDEPQLTKMRQLGMTSSEETKLMAMRDYIAKLANAISSFATRVNWVQDNDSGMRTIADIELSKLNVVPQTVFLRPRVTDPSSIGSPRSPFRRSLNDQTTRTAGSSLRNHRMSSADSAPFEDLRRRLATINNASASSLNIGSPGPRVPNSPLASVGSTPLSPAERGNPLERPGSPTESVVSTANSTSFRPLSRMQMSNVESQKAAPAVGSSRANATGLLDAHTPIMPDFLSAETSGRASPMSMSATIRDPARPAPIAISSYDGQEPGVNNLLEKMYLDNNRELQHDFGPRIREGPVRRRNPVRHSFASHSDKERKMEAVLIAHLTSHTDSINGIAVSPDHMFYVSCSDDKTVKVWDTARLERNVTSKPRHTYGQHHAKVKCVCILENSHCFASAAEDGSLHIVRVHNSVSGNLPKYGKLQLVREHHVGEPGEYITGMTHWNTDTCSNLLYMTSHSNVVLLDLRTMQVLQSMENPRHFGPITAFCMDKKRSWVVVGTSTGVLSLWDRRFGLLLKRWQVNASSKGKLTCIRQCAVHPTKGKGRWILISVDTSTGPASVVSNLVEVWDIENFVMVESFVVRQGSDSPLPSLPTPGVDANSSAATSIAALVRSRQAADSEGSHITGTTPAYHVRAMVSGIDFGGHSLRSDLLEDGLSSRSSERSGYIITGSEDTKIRFWDLSNPERSTVLSGGENDSHSVSYSMKTQGTACTYVETWGQNKNHNSRAPQRISLITQNQQTLLKAHQDVITCLALLDSPFRGGLISGDRAGVLKVWRIDQTEQ